MWGSADSKPTPLCTSHLAGWAANMAGHDFCALMTSDVIRIVGARQHNLKNLTLEIPRQKLVVVTGLSGSGKSSLAFDTLYAEGQRRYVESLSAYARQFLDQMQKPDVEHIEGLSPAIAIEQRSSAGNPRSTIATTTEIYDYLRVLYSAIGTPHDPNTGRIIRRMTPQQIVDAILSLPPETKIIVLAPVVAGEVGEFRDVIENSAGRALSAFASMARSWNSVARNRCGSKNPNPIASRQSSIGSSCATASASA